jgi:hypothetical protein
LSEDPTVNAREIEAQPPRVYMRPGSPPRLFVGNQAVVFTDKKVAALVAGILIDWVLSSPGT